MKKILWVFCLTLLSIFSANAQKTVFVLDHDLLESPQYKAAQAELDQLSLTWKKEIEAKYAEIDYLLKIYGNKLKKEYEADIKQKELAAGIMLTQRFGANGNLFKKRCELLKKLTE